MTSPQEPEFLPPLDLSKVEKRPPSTESIPELSPTENVTLPLSMNVQKRTARTTLVLSVTHEAPDMRPACLESRSVQTTENLEQPFERYLTVGESWQPLDTGWVEEVAMLLLNNQGKGVLQVGWLIGVLTDQEKKRRTMHDPPLPPPSVVIFTSLLPREGIPFRPENVARLVVRCTEGSTKFQLIALPR